MKTSKFFLSTLIAAAAMSANAYSAELSTLATMNELVSAGTIGEGVSLNTGYTSASTVYDFTGSGAITDISSESVLNAINQDSGWITIAAYINPDGVSNVQSIFGYGAQQDGFKFATNGSALQFTTKGVLDIGATGNDVTAGEWTLVAVTINLADGDGSRYLVGASGFYTRDFGTWNDPAEENQTFAIGSGNSDGNRELFSGSIANLTVFTSTERATNEDVLAALGSAPVIQIDTTGKLVWAGTQENSTWNTSADNTIWLDGETPKAFTAGTDVAFTDDATFKTVSLESGATVTAGDVSVGGSGYSFVVSSGTATISGKTLTVSDGAVLSVGDSKNRTVDLNFENIVLSGKISYNNGDDTWSALDFAGGELHINDGANPGTNLTITSVAVSEHSTITATWDKALNIGALSGSANLSMTGGLSGRLTVGISSLDEYSGTLTTNNGSWGLTVNLGQVNASTTTSANVMMNSGIVNIAGTTTLTGTVTQVGGDLNLGDSATVGTLKIGNGTVSGTEGAKIGNFYFGVGSSAKTATLSGSLNITGDMLETEGNNGETITLSEGAKVSVVGTFGTKSVNANDGGQHTYVLNVGNDASFSAGTIAHGDQLTVNVGTGASVSADTMTFNACWGDKGHTFTGQGASTSKVSAETLNLNGNMTFAANSVRVNLGSVNGGSASSKLSLTNSTIGVTEGSDGWSTAASVLMSGANAVDVADKKIITLSGVLSGDTASLSKIGAGTLTLSGNNTYSGGTTVSAGTLVAASENALGSGDVSVADNAKLSLGTASVTINNLSGAGDVDLADGTSAATLTINSTKDTSFSGNIGSHVSDNSKVFSLIKEGSGTFALAEGLIENLSVNAGTFVTNPGIYADSVSVSSGATLKVVPVGIATYGGSFEFASGAQLLVDLGNLAVPADANANNAVIAVDVIAAEVIKFGDVTLSQGDSITLPEEFVTVVTSEALSKYINQTWSYNGGVLSLTLAIPEPSLFGLLAGLGALTLVGTRRRRSKKA